MSMRPICPSDGCELPRYLLPTPSTPVPSDVSPALNSSRILIVGVDSAQLRPARSGALHLRSGVSGALSLAAKSIPAQLTFPLFSTQFQMTDIEKPAEKQTEFPRTTKALVCSIVASQDDTLDRTTDDPRRDSTDFATQGPAVTGALHPLGSSRDLPSKFHDSNRPPVAGDRARRTAQ